MQTLAAEHVPPPSPPPFPVSVTLRTAGVSTLLPGVVANSPDGEPRPPPHPTTATSTPIPTRLIDTVYRAIFRASVHEDLRVGGAGVDSERREVGQDPARQRA